jgi:hypothetical protein
VDFTVARLGNDKLATAFGTLVPLTYLVSHFI